MLFRSIRALDEWRHYIQGSPHTTTILSDHKNLTYYREARKLTRQARWSLHLSEFDIKLVHTPGHKMVQSDTLSRRPDFVPVDDDDNDDMTMLPDSLFINLIDTELQERIALCNTMDKDAIDALSTLLGDPNITRHELEDWTLEKFNGKNILFFKGKIGRAHV